MAITARTLFKSPAVLLVTTLSVGGMAFLGLIFISLLALSGSVEESEIPYIATDFDACKLTAVSPDDQFTWTEAEWVGVAFCYEGLKDSMNAELVASEGLSYFPRSEALYNIKAYHQIEQKNHAGAIVTLRTGLGVIGRPTNGTMENNLAWAGLFEPTLVPVTEARDLYLRSLARDPQSCETAHTGMWVEYAATTQANEGTRVIAARNYKHLRKLYDGCEARLKGGDIHTIEEVLGAGVLDYEMARNGLLRDTAGRTRLMVANALVQSARTEANRTGSADASELCQNAMPLPGLQSVCEERFLVANTRPKRGKRSCFQNVD